MLDRLVSEIMTSNPVTVEVGDSLLVVKKIFESRNFHHHIPVVDAGKLAGIISLYDFIIAMKGASLDDDEPVYQQTLASDIMSRDVMSCSPSTPVKEIVALIMKHQIHGIPVVQDNRLLGIVTTHDILKKISES